MIGYLKGKITSFEENTVILNINGCGYEVIIPSNYDFKLNEEYELYIHTNVKETEISLYGFKTKEELRFFKKLINISGIGPKIAVVIVAYGVSKVLDSIETENISLLISIPGIGKKVASRIILELKGKIEDFSGDKKSSINKDIVDTLVNLGYQKKSVLDLLSKIDKTFENEEDLIRYCIKNL